MSRILTAIFAGLIQQVDANESRLTYRQLLGRRMYLNALVRYGVAFVFVLGGSFAGKIFDVQGVNVEPLIYIGVAIAIYNTPIYWFVRQFRLPDLSYTEFGKLRSVMYSAIILDFLSLAVVVYELGGARSPFMAFYVLHVTLSCVMLSGRAAMLFTGLAYVLVSIQVIGEWSGIGMFTKYQNGNGVVIPLSTVQAVETLVVYGLLFAMLDILLISVTAWLRRDERVLRLKNEQLDRLSRMRRDYLHVATHNLKSPIGAAMMMLEKLENELAGPINEKQREWIERCSIRLGGLMELLGDLQLLGELETEELDKRFQPIDLGMMLQEIIEEVRLNAQVKEQTLKAEIAENLPAVRGIDRLVREAIVNYLTNAIKYTPNGGRIVLRAFTTGGPGAGGGKREGRLRIEVEDNGIGIAREKQDRLFGEFQRIDKAKSLRNGIPGTGLGLSIVKRIVEAHGGVVGVESDAGSGSVFYMELPTVHSGV